jgi:hypothetical protein
VESRPEELAHAVEISEDAMRVAPNWLEVASC